MICSYMTKLAMSLEERMFLMTALVMLQIILMPCASETPSYLLMRGKVEVSIIKQIQETEIIN